MFDAEYQLQTDGLAESVEADNPTPVHHQAAQTASSSRTARPLTADDVIYSLQRIGTENNGLTGFAATATMDIKDIKKMDDLTVRLPLLVADSTIPQTLASYTFGIVPEGYKAFSGDLSTQIGTGPYKLKSFTPGQESTARAQPQLLARRGSPSSTPSRSPTSTDATAQVNALLGGDIDAMTDLPADRSPSRAVAGREGR